MRQILNPEEFLRIVSAYLTETSDGLAILNITRPSFPIVYINKGFSLITGYSVDEVIGESLCFVLGQNLEGDCHKNILKFLEKPEPFSIETQYLKKDNNIRDALISSTPVRGVKDKIENVVLVLEDITEKKYILKKKLN